MPPPQGQALAWIRNREAKNVPPWQNTTLNDPKLRDKLEYCMENGKSLVIVQVKSCGRGSI